MNALVVLDLSLLQFIVSSLAKSRHEITAGLHAQKIAPGNGSIGPFQCASAVTNAMITASFQVQCYVFFILYHKCN